MTVKTYSDGEVLFAADLNSSLEHGITSVSSSPISFTPTDGTTTVLIIVKAEWSSTGSVTGYDFTLTLTSDLDGTLDVSQTKSYTLAGATTVVQTIPLQYTGTLSAGTHSISIVLTGTTGTISNVKMVGLEL